MVDLGRVRHVGGVVQFQLAAVGPVDAVDDRGRGQHEVEVELAREALLDDLEVKEAEKAAAEAEAERARMLGDELEARVVEAELAERIAQVLEVRGIDREHAAEHHRLGRPEARQGRRRRAAVLGDRVADAGIRDVLDARREEADLAGAERLLELEGLGRQHADAVDLVDRAGAHHADLHALAEPAVLDPGEDHDAEIGVVPAVDEQRLERGVDLALGRRQARDDRLQHVLDALAGLGRDHERVVGGEADDVLDLLADALGLGGRQVDLVEHRHDLVPGVDRLVGVGERLRLDALGRVDQQERALAGAQRAAHLVGKIDMARGVDEVELVDLAVLRLVAQAHGLRLDRDAALALELHAVEHLRLHLARLEPAAALDDAVGERRLAVVDMRHDREVADPGEVGHAGSGRTGRALSGISAQPATSISSPARGGSSPARSSSSSALPTSPRAARSLKYSSVRRAESFSATATLMNWLSVVPSALATRSASLFSEACNLNA